VVGQQGRPHDDETKVEAPVSTLPKHPPRSLDKSAINKEAVVEICAHYAGPGRTLGTRTTWRCPRCGKNKLEAVSGRGLAGCWNGRCPVPRTTDSLGLIAFFEELDLDRDFRRVLERGHEILGLEAHHAKPARRLVSRRPEKFGPERSTDAELLDAAYSRLLCLCPASKRDLRYWEGRGVSPGTARRARLGSITPARARAAVTHLEKEFGEKRLLCVPGFFVNRSGRLSCTLVGDYALIPYHDREGRITTLEGRAIVRPGQLERTDRYISLRGSGCHLYVFPGVSPHDLEAFTEGPVGAIVAAQEGLRVGAIKGIRCHKNPDGSPLVELAGTDLGGRVVPYIPDADDPPKEEVLAEAPKAARSLTVAHNGRPALAALPRGMDLDEWLLSLPRSERRRAFRALLKRAQPLPPTASPQRKEETP